MNTIAPPIFGRGGFSDLEVFAMFTIGFNRNEDSGPSQLDEFSQGEFNLWELKRNDIARDYNLPDEKPHTRVPVEVLAAFYQDQERNGTEESYWAEPPEIAVVDDIAPARILFGESE